MGAIVEVDPNKPIIFFDGVCNLCNGAVTFLIKRDPKAMFQFISLQSDLSKNLLPGMLTSDLDPDSIILQVKGKTYVKSDAVLHIALRMRFPWNLLFAFVVIPKFIRDGIYDWVAKNRYRWYGRQDQCMIPTLENQRRFPNCC